MIFKPGLHYENGAKYSQCEIDNYFVDYVRVGRRLFITFEGAGNAPVRPMGARKPWGFDFLTSRGFSVLGVKPKRVDWYRGACLHTFFRSDVFADIISSHDKVYLYGGSMGGYAALTFAKAVHGCTVISINPQSTLDPELVPWETRWKVGQEQDWKGDFSDGAVGARCAQTVYVAYDPLLRADRKQIERQTMQISCVSEFRWWATCFRYGFIKRESCQR
jgi:hypothetical protein